MRARRSLDGPWHRRQRRGVDDLLRGLPHVREVGEELGLGRERGLGLPHRHRLVQSPSVEREQQIGGGPTECHVALAVAVLPLVAVRGEADHPLAVGVGGVHMNGLATPPQLGHAGRKGSTRRGWEGMDLPLHRFDIRDCGVVEILAPDERRQLLQDRFTRRNVARTGTPQRTQAGCGTQQGTTTRRTRTPAQAA